MAGGALAERPAWSRNARSPGGRAPAGPQRDAGARPGQGRDATAIKERGLLDLMKRYGFVEKDVEPSDVYAHLKQYLVSNGFQIDTEAAQPNFWDLRASKRGVSRIVLGAVRDADVVVAGTRGKFEVQFKLGVWGRDLAIPVVEGIATLGLATAVDLHEEHTLEDKMWQSIVRMIDPSLQICWMCGSIFRSPEELKTHQQAEIQQDRTVGGLPFGTGMMMMPMLWI